MTKKALNMKKLACLASLLVFGLVACGGQAPAIPTAILNSTPTSEKSPSAPATTTANITQIASQQDCDGNLEKPAESQNFSPDQSWRFVSCLDPKTGFLYTKLIEVNGSKSWSVPFYEIFGIGITDKSFLEGLKGKSARMLITHWSGDGHYAYFYPEICCIDGPTLFNGIPALYQLDLHTGELKDKLLGGRIGFSPDDKYLAYRTLPATVHLQNLETGHDRSFQLESKYINLGVFSWSPDSQKLVFVAALEDWDKNMFMYEPTPGGKNGFSLLLLNLETMKITTLIDNDIRLLVPGSALYYESDNAWADNDEIYLAQMNIAGRDEGKIWLYDINKQQLNPFSTPIPTSAP